MLRKRVLKGFFGLPKSSFGRGKFVKTVNHEFRLKFYAPQTKILEEGTKDEFLIFE
jgi:hypothetical protein